MTIIFLYALFLTIIIETGSLLVLRELALFKLEKIKLNKIIFAGFITSFATLPYLWFVGSYFLGDNYLLHTIIGELSVFIIESIMYYFILEISYKKAFIISFIVNLVSYSIGLLII